MDLRITLRGLPQFNQKMRAIPPAVTREVAKTLVTQAEKIMRRSKEEFVPVDVATLKGSGHVRPPEISGTRVSVTLGFGGAASDYALIQHERMDFHHTVGGPKYLEQPVLQAEGEVQRAVGEAVERAARRAS